MPDSRPPPLHRATIVISLDSCAYRLSNAPALDDTNPGFPIMRLSSFAPSPLLPTKHLFALFLLLILFCPQPGHSEILSHPHLESRYGLAPAGARLRCYFSGRWITPNLGAANIDVTGSSLSGVSRRFDKSLAQNLYEMKFNAQFGDSSRSADGNQNYRFLTGLLPASYSGSINFRLLPNVNQMRVTYSNGFFTFEEIWVKTKSGACS